MVMADPQAWTSLPNPLRARASILTSINIYAILPAMKRLPQVEDHANSQTSNECASGTCGDGDSAARYYPETAEAARLFHALADETRLAILRQLRDEGAVCACDFRACCTLAQPTVSHHLKVLREARLVTAEKRGLWVHYQLNEEAMERIRALLP